MSDDKEPTPRELLTTLIRHDSAISGLSGDMAGLKKEVKALDSTVANGFTSLGQELGKLTATNAARPHFDPHQALQSLLAIMIIFSMVVGGIIWVTSSQYAVVIAKQEGVNTSIAEKLSDLETRLRWIPSTTRENQP